MINECLYGKLAGLQLTGYNRITQLTGIYQV